MSRASAVGDFKLQWGESLRWDDRRQRLYFVDCAAETLHWLEAGQPPLRTMSMPSLPTGLVLSEDGRIVVALDDGLYVVDVDSASLDLLTPYPSGLGGRANDATADPDGNLVTGTLNSVPTTDGSYWWYSSRQGWKQLDNGIGNANGPVVLDIDQRSTLVFADTLAFALYAYDYDGPAGVVRDRRVFADTREIGGMPDGACADSDEGVWTCLLGAGKIVRYGADGVQHVVETGVELPSDVTFGGEGLERMFFVSIAVPPMPGLVIKSPLAGALMAVDDSGFRGRPEPRFRL